MKKILIAYGILVLAVVILAFAKFNGFSFLSFSKPVAEINGKKINLLVANDDKSRQVGLSGKKSLPENEGMLFVFEKKGKYSFWMKETLIPLDMIFIDENTIVDIVKNAQPAKGNNPLPIYTPKAEANYVLEVNGGLSDKNAFKPGDKVTLSGIK